MSIPTQLMKPNRNSLKLTFPLLFQSISPASVKKSEQIKYIIKKQKSSNFGLELEKILKVDNKLKRSENDKPKSYQMRL